jgi:hypothetical protein
MYDSILGTEYNFISSKYIGMYFCSFLNTIKLFPSVKLSEPNNKFSIEIGVYDVICSLIISFLYSYKGYILISNEYHLLT